MFVAIGSSDYFQVTTKVVGSGQSAPDEDSFSVYDTVNGGITSLDKCFDTPTQNQIHSHVEISNVNSISDNSLNPLAFINAYDSNDTILDIVNYDILNNSNSGVIHDTLIEFSVSLESYKTIESTTEGIAAIRCESDLSQSPLDNFISGFECEEITGSRRGKTIYDVRYRRSKIRI